MKFLFNYIIFNDAPEPQIDSIILSVLVMIFNQNFFYKNSFLKFNFLLSKSNTIGPFITDTKFFSNLDLIYIPQFDIILLNLSGIW